MIDVTDKYDGKQSSVKRVKVTKYVLISLLCLALLFEILWTFYICKAFKEDLNDYKEDQIWKKEFYKATRNFFVFTIILLSLATFIGFAGAYSENKILMILFIVAFVMEWGFELIGIYASGDLNVAIYKLICELTKPAVLIVAVILLYFIKEKNDDSWI